MKTIFSLLIPASLLLAGCTADETPGTSPVTPPVEATVPLSIESAIVNAEVSTRSTSPLTSGSIGVFLKGGEYPIINNRQYDYATPQWNPHGGVGNTIYLGSANANVCAYYPWNSSISSTSIDLTTRILSDYSQDICYATSKTMNGSSGNNSVNFVMKHAYAQLEIIYKRDGYPGRGFISGTEVRNLLNNTKLDISTGVYSASVGNTSSSLSVKINDDLPQNGQLLQNGVLSLIIPCTPATNQTKLIVTVDDKTMTTNVPYVPKAGEFTKITISVQGTNIKVNSVSVEEWQEKNMGNVIPIP